MRTSKTNSRHAGVLRIRLYYIALLLPLCTAAWFSIHLAISDTAFQLHTPESVARAIEIEPRNTDYLALRALQLDYDGADATAVLERAATLSPLNSAPRIRLGLTAEIHGDHAAAEKWLLDAARVDRQFEPRWTLANFYFRQEDNAAFFKWIRDALDVSYGDRRPAFDLCWRIADAQTLLTRAIPDRHEVVAAYMTYVLDAHRDAAAPVVMKLAEFHDPSDRESLLGASDVIISTGDVRSARDLWSALGLAAPSGIFNPNFSSRPLDHGFDWRWTESTGVVQIPVDQPRPAWRIALDGRQSESCSLLTQMVILEPRAHYTLRWDARTSGFGEPSGLEWRIGDVHAPVSAGAAEFVAPAQMAPLVLFYQRPLGQARAEGSIEIASVSLERITF